MSSILDPRAKTIPFTFTLRLDEDFWEGLEMECAGEADAIETARELLRVKIDDRPLMAGLPRRGAVGVGIGSMLNARDRLVWLGEWEWSEPDGWSWTSSD